MTDPAALRQEAAMANGSAVRIARVQAGRNAAIVESAYEALNSGDIDALRILFHAHASWHSPGLSPIAGNRRGREAICTQFRRYGGETGGTFKANLLNVLESEDGRVVSVHHTSAERRGRRIDVLCCIVFELEDGRIVIGREHFYDLYAWDMFWS
jgi:ketosteroid isomerase-like protein